MSYNAIVEKSEDGGYWASVRELPGCYSEDMAEIAAAKGCRAARAKCRLCVKYPRPNAKTLAAIREAKEIEGEISAGTRTPMTLGAFLAEMERV